MYDDSVIILLTQCYYLLLCSTTALLAYVNQAWHTQDIPWSVKRSDPKRFVIFPPDCGGCSEGLGAFDFSLNNRKFIEGQTSENGIPPWFPAAKGYTWIHLDIWASLATLIGQLSLVPLFDTIIWRYTFSRLLRSTRTVFGHGGVPNSGGVRAPPAEHFQGR